MSGSEGLAVLGVLMAVAQDYDCVLKPIQRYRKFPRTIFEFPRKLGILENRYSDTGQLLLKIVFGNSGAAGEKAREMFEDSTHPAWGAPGLESRICKHLGRRYPTCQIAVESVKTALARIKPISDEFAAILDRSLESTSTSGLKKRASDIVTKLRYCLSESKIDLKLKELISATEDFERLVRLHGEISSHSVDLCEPYTRRLSSGVALRFQTTQSAANKLYKNLQDSCTEHERHHTHFNLLPTVQIDRRRVGFELAYGEVDSGHPSTELVWLAIESSIASEQIHITHLSESAPNDCVNVEDDVDRSISSNLKRHVESVEIQNTFDKKLLSSRVKNDISAIQARAQSCTAVPPASRRSSNVSEHRSLCTQIRTYWRADIQHAECIGYLEKQPFQKHLIYIKPSPQNTGGPTSLHSFWDLATNIESQQRLSKFDKLCLARSMATATLHFYRSPWLMNGIWRSKDINLMPTANALSLGSPHINIVIEAHERQNGQGTETQHPQCIRNHALFSLGLLLIEIAFESPIHKLRQPVDLDDGSSHVEFNTAKRLSNTTQLAREMGSLYQCIVKRCLFCLSESSDLEEPELQLMLYEDVIRDLEFLEGKSRQLQ